MNSVVALTCGLRRRIVASGMPLAAAIFGSVSPAFTVQVMRLSLTVIVVAVFGDDE